MGKVIDFPKNQIQEPPGSNFDEVSFLIDSKMRASVDEMVREFKLKGDAELFRLGVTILKYYSKERKRGGKLGIFFTRFFGRYRYRTIELVLPPFNKKAPIR